MPSLPSLLQRRKRLIRQIQDHLDFLIGSVSSKGLPSEAYNLTTKIDGVTRSRHIPRDLLPLVRRMTQRHQVLKHLLKELSQTNWMLLREGVELKDHGTL